MGHSRVMHDWMRCRCDILFPSVQPHKSASNSLQDSHLPCADATLSLGLMDSSLAEIAPSLDLDLSPIQGQLASAVVNLNGDVIRGSLPPDDARLSVVQADAGAWVADPAHAGSAQVLCVDLYDHEAAAPVLDSAAFYADCRAVLADGGVMTVNLFGRASSFAASAQRIAAAFGRDQAWSLRPTREGNTVVVAGRALRVPEREELLARAEAIERRTGLPARKWLRMVRPLQP